VASPPRLLRLPKLRRAGPPANARNSANPRPSSAVDGLSSGATTENRDGPRPQPAGSRSIQGKFSDNSWSASPDGTPSCLASCSTCSSPRAVWSCWAVTGRLRPLPSQDATFLPSPARCSLATRPLRLSRSVLHRNADMIAGRRPASPRSPLFECCTDLAGDRV
jgi:hypothetical protein